MWDFATDPATGDWLFSANRDVAGIDGDSLDRQRIMNRLKITRGSFNYDETGVLGSRLREAGSRISTAQAEIGMPILIEEALEPMEDIIVRNVSVTVNEDEPGRIDVALSYSHAIDPDETILTPDETDEFLFTITV